MSTSKLFARRLLGGKVSVERARLRDCCKVSEERALLRDCCRITEPVQGGSIADSQLRIDEERSLEVVNEVIGKLYNGPACDSRMVNEGKQLGSAKLSAASPSTTLP